MVGISGRGIRVCGDVRWLEVSWVSGRWGRCECGLLSRGVGEVCE